LKQINTTVLFVFAAFLHYFTPYLEQLDLILLVEIEFEIDRYDADADADETTVHNSWNELYQVLERDHPFR